MSDCPCGSTKNYAECCGRFISGQQQACTPEELMRSRYSAYTQANIDYITRTMKYPTPLDTEWTEQIKWKKLEVIRSSVSGTKGIVEFKAYFSVANKASVLHEVSEFLQEEGKWYYIDGQVSEYETPAASSKIGRNDVCSCGSGKKYKKCCGK